MGTKEDDEIYNSLVAILTKDDFEENNQHDDDLKFILETLQTCEVPKILRISIQTLQKICMQKLDIIYEAFESLAQLIQKTKDRALKIASVQTIATLSKIADRQISKLLEIVKSLMSELSSDNVASRSLKEASDALTRALELHSIPSTNEPDETDQIQSNEEDVIEHTPNDDEPEVKYSDDEEDYQEDSCDRNNDDNDTNDDDGDNDEDNAHRRTTEENDNDEPLHNGQRDRKPSTTTTTADTGLNLGEKMDTTTLSQEAFIDQLTTTVKDALQVILNELTEVRLREIHGRLKNFYKPNFTNPGLVEKHMRLTSHQVRSLMNIAGFHCRVDHCITPMNFKRLQQATETVTSTDFYETAKKILGITNVAVDKRFTIDTDKIKTNDNGNSYKNDADISPRGSGNGTNKSASSSKIAPHSGGVVERALDGTVIREHDDATPFLLLRNLPLDVTVNELVDLLRQRSGCDYLESKDVIIPASSRHSSGSIGAHAYVNFQHIKDARKARNELNGRNFGGRPLEIEYSLGKPNNSVWIGAVPAGLTQEKIESCMKRFGPVARIDLRRRSTKGDAFAFAVYDNVEDAIVAVKTMAERGNKIDGYQVRIGYSSSKTDQQASSGMAAPVPPPPPPVPYASGGMYPPRPIPPVPSKNYAGSQQDDRRDSRSSKDSRPSNRDTSPTRRNMNASNKSNTKSRRRDEDDDRSDEDEEDDDRRDRNKKKNLKRRSISSSERDDDDDEDDTDHKKTWRDRPSTGSNRKKQTSRRTSRQSDDDDEDDNNSRSNEGEKNRSKNRREDDRSESSDGKDDAWRDVASPMKRDDKRLSKGSSKGNKRGRSPSYSDDGSDSGDDQRNRKSSGSGKTTKRTKKGSSYQDDNDSEEEYPKKRVKSRQDYERYDDRDSGRKSGSGGNNRPDSRDSRDRRQLTSTVGPPGMNRSGPPPFPPSSNTRQYNSYGSNQQNPPPPPSRGYSSGGPPSQGGMYSHHMPPPPPAGPPSMRRNGGGSGGPPQNTGGSYYAPPPAPYGSAGDSYNKPRSSRTTNSGNYQNNNSRYLDPAFIPPTHHRTSAPSSSSSSSNPSQQYPPGPPRGYY